jgi:hypothetical protein
VSRQACASQELLCSDPRATIREARARASRIRAGRRRAQWRVHRPLLGGPNLLGEVEGAVDQSDVAVGLGKVAHSLPLRGSISSASRPTSSRRSRRVGEGGELPMQPVTGLAAWRLVIQTFRGDDMSCRGDQAARDFAPCGHMHLFGWES